MAAPNAAPYKISKRGDKYVVVNNANAVKATFADRNKAIAYLRALYANVPGAKRKAAKVKWTGKAKVPVKAAADTSPWTPRQLWHMAAAAGYQRADVEADTLQAPVDDDLEDTIMALLDATFTMLEQMGVEVLSLELQHALEAVKAGEPINDKILALLGIDDEDTAMTEAAADSAKPYGNVSYADPGYQKDKKKRYPIDTADHVRSAWSYISQSSNASKYSPAQRESIKARIRTAAKKFKVELSEPQKADAWDRYAELERLEQQQAAIEELRAMGRTCHCDVDDGGHAQDCPSWGMPIEEAVVTPEHKTKKGKHRFVGTQHVKSTVYSGAGWGGICIACGRPDTDPDHDGDVDTPGGSGDTDDDAGKTPVAASDQTFGGLSIPNGNQLIWNGTPPGHSQVFPMYTYTLGTNSSASFGSQPTISGFVQVTDRAKENETKPFAPTPEPVKAFVTELNGKTLVTGPASTFTPLWEKALSPNEQMLWLQGRFVGAEKANRNGAFWSTADLELGEATVRYGPLNWLHEAKHVIGTIADTRLVAHEQASDQPLAEPYIQAASVIWRWVYPDEASVVEMASDSGKLWYSMECISKNVECVGDGGCGRTVAYMDYITGEKACDHMKARSTTRRFADPTFLGGAVIMPPARPGWAEADASVMRTAANLAEKAFDQAGQPDISASDWEQLMAEVVRFAS
jgi:hypothetical protein